MALTAYVVNVGADRMMGTASSAGPAPNRRRWRWKARRPESPAASKEIHLPEAK